MTQNDVDTALNWVIANYAGHRVGDANGQYVGECLSLAKRYFTRLTGKAAPASGNGKGSGYYTVFPAALRPYFSKQAFVPGKTYPRGSLVVYTKTSHIGIFLSAGSPNCSLFEQNADPDGSPASTHQRPNSHIDGILVPIVAAAPAGGDWTGKTVYLKPVPSWRVYVPNTHNVRGTLLPAKYGGLSYTIRGKDSLGRALIDTTAFGKVALPIDGDATIK